MENKDFAVFILTHGRPDNVKTLSTIKKAGYTGKIFFIVDNEDKTVHKYIENFGAESVKVFDKKYYADNVDEGNNFDNMKVIIHARNACFDIAKDLNIKYFVQFDDDYYYFGYRYLTGAKIIKNIDAVFDSMIEFYKTTTIKTICFSQGGGHIVGIVKREKRQHITLAICNLGFICFRKFVHLIKFYVN